MVPSLRGRQVPLCLVGGREVGDLQPLCISIRESIANMLWKKTNNQKP